MDNKIEKCLKSNAKVSFRMNAWKTLDPFLAMFLDSQIAKNATEESVEMSQTLIL